jgi:hypothetical protein
MDILHSIKLRHEMKRASRALRYLTDEGEKEKEKEKEALAKAAESACGFAEEGRLIRSIIFKLVRYERLVTDPAKERARRRFRLFWCPSQNPH